MMALLVALPATAQSDDVLFGVRAGIVELDCLDIEGADCVDTDIGYGGGVFLDYGLSSSLSGGLYADVNSIGGEFGEDDSELMVDVGATLKTAFGDRTRRAYFRPGVGVGYGHLDLGETARMLTTRATLEVVLPQAGLMSWLVEGGLYYAPLGSADDVDVTFGPGFLLRVGALF